MYKPSQGWGTKKRNATSPRSYGERVLASTGPPGGVSGTPPAERIYRVDHSVRTSMGQGQKDSCLEEGDIAELRSGGFCGHTFWGVTLILSLKV